MYASLSILNTAQTLLGQKAGWHLVVLATMSRLYSSYLTFVHIVGIPMGASTVVGRDSVVEDTIS